MANALGRIGKLIDRKIAKDDRPNKATVVRVDQNLVDITLGPGSGVIQNVEVKSGAEAITPGATVAIEWIERAGGYLAPLVQSGFDPDMIDADMLEGYRASAFAQKAISITLNVSPDGSDDNPGTASEPLKTIQAAVNLLKGRVLANCVIQLAEGTHTTDGLLIDGFVGSVSGLKILGDTGHACLGRPYGTGMVLPLGISNVGQGTMTLTRANDGQDGRLALYVKGSTSNPNFVADGIIASDGVRAGHRVLLWTGTQYHDLEIFQVSQSPTLGARLVLDSTLSIASIDAAKCYFVIQPKVILTATGGHATIRFSGVNLSMEGCYIVSNGCVTGVLIDGGSNIIFNKNVVYATGAGSTGVQVLMNSSLDTVWHNVYVGYYMAVYANAKATASVPTSMFHAVGAAGVAFYANTASLGSVQYSSCAYGAGAGIISSLMSMVYAASSNGFNHAATPYSPGVSGAVGNTGAYVVF